MPFQVVTGRFGDIESALVEHLRDKRPLDPVLVIARSQRVARRLQWRLADPVALNVHWTTIEQAGAQLAAEEDDGRRVVADTLVLENLILELIREYFRDTVYLSRAIRSHKTAAALHLTLRDIKEADIPLDQLSQVLNDPGIVEKDRLSEIFRLYELYEKALEIHKIHDPDDLLRLAARRVRTSPWLDEMTRVFVYGFYDLNQLQWNLVEQLARHRTTTLFVPLTPAPGAEFARRFFSHYIQPLCARLQSPIKAIEPKREPFEDRLFTEDLSPIECPVTIVNASGRHDEVWFAAKHIVELLQKGIAPREIGVIARSLEDYADTINSIFRDNQIPYTLSAKESIRAWPIVQTIEALVELPDLDYERSAVLKVLASGYFRKPAQADPTLWNLGTSLLGIGRGERTWLNRLDAAIEKGGVRRDSEDRDSDMLVPAEQLGMLRETFSTLVRTLQRLPARAAWMHYVQIVVAVLRELLTDTDRIVDLIRDLDALEHVWLGRQVDRREFVDTLVEKLERTRLLGHQNIAGVSVLDAMSARGLSFRHVFLLGVNEKTFPRYVSEEPFLSDHNRALIGMTLGAKLDTKREAYLHERMLYYLALGSATERVTLSYQRANDEGRVLAPSVFLREVAYRLPQAQGLTFDEFVSRHVPQCNRLQLAEFERLESLTPAELFMRVDDEPVLEQFADDRELIRRALDAVRESEGAETLGARDGIVGAPFGEFWSSYARRVSPTFLEQYATCPMKCFLGRVLDLRPFERPEEIEQATPLDLGNIAHRTLAAFYEAYEGRDPEGVLDRAWKKVTSAFDEQRFVRYPLLWSLDKKMLYAALRKFLVEFDLPAWAARPIVNKRCEVTPPRAVPLPGVEGVQFRGTLDRLFELSDGAVRVDDYKWKVKGAGSSVQAALRGRAIQLAIYTRLAASMVPDAKRIQAHLILLRRILEPKNLKEAIGEEPPEILEELPEDFWEVHGAAFASHLSALVAMLKQGTFFVNPETGADSACRFCDFATACRKSHYPTAQRPHDDPGAQPYWNVRNAS